MPPNCGHSPDDPVKHYTNLSISNFLTGSGAIWGWDWHVPGSDNYLDPATWVDMMGYCNNEWIADYTYNAIRDQLISGNDPHPAQASTTLNAMLVVGSMPAYTDTVNLLPIQVLPNVTLPITPTVGSYAIVQYDSLGARLSSRAFNLPPASVLTDTLESRGRHFAELVPVAPGVKKVTIERANGARLFSVQAGLGAPQVTVNAPTPNSPRPGDLTVSWSASDPDSDPLNFSVAYSQDNGATWQTGYSAITHTLATFSLAHLPAGKNALFRVYASDGVHSAFGDSPTFAVPNHLPSLDLLSPQVGLTIVPTDTLELRASAADIDLGRLPDSAITWRSNRDGVLAHGPLAVISGLSAGSHIISASVDDGQGGVASKSVLVTVVKYREDLPPPASALLVDPPVILLDQPAGQLQAQISIFNQAGPNTPLAWTVASDAAWLKLDAASGTAPGRLGVTLDPTGLADGMHYATLTFTRADVNETVKVRVAALTGKTRLFMPVVRK